MEDAQTAAEKYKKKLKEKTGVDGNIEGYANDEAVKGAEIIVLTVPYKALKATLESINPYIDENAVVLSPIVDMKMNEDRTFDYVRPQIGSAAEEVKQGLTKTKKVVAAFHNVPAKKLANYGEPLDCTVAICGDDQKCNIAPELFQESNVIAELIKEMRVLIKGPAAILSLTKAA